jgi:hypothetical protein
VLAPIIVKSVRSYCLHPDSIRSFGDGTKKSADSVSELIDGGAGLYLAYRMRRYDSLAYQEAGSGNEVQIALSTFDRPENAYALFVHRVLANADPDEAKLKAADRKMSAFKAGGAAVLANGAAYLWRGKFLVELTLNAESATPQQAKKIGAEVLPAFAEALGQSLPGSTEPPPEVRLLPSIEDGRIALGIDYIPPAFSWPADKGEALKVPTTGGYASALMHEGIKRFRILVFLRESKDEAREITRFLRALNGAKHLPDYDEADDAVYFPYAVGEGGAGAGAKAEGIAVRFENKVYALTDEEFELGDPSQKEAYPRLSKDEKVARLKKYIARLKALPKASAPSASASVSKN